MCLRVTGVTNVSRSCLRAGVMQRDIGWCANGARRDSREGRVTALPNSLHRLASLCVPGLFTGKRLALVSRFCFNVSAIA